MKFIIALCAFVSLMFGNISTASELNKLNIIIPGKTGGTMAEMAESFKDHLEKNGISVNSQLLGSWSTGGNQYITSNDPTILLWASAVIADWRQTGNGAPIDITEENFLSLLSREHYMICSRSDKNLGVKEFLNSKNAKFGYFSYHENFVIELDNNLSSASFVPVPYSGSSARMKGLISGDIDYAFVSLKHGKRAMKEGNVSCFITTEPKESSFNKEILNLEEILPDFEMNNFSIDHFILVKGFNKEQKQKLLEITKEFTNSQKWKTYLAKIGSTADIQENSITSVKKAVDSLTPKKCQPPFPCN